MTRLANRKSVVSPPDPEMLSLVKAVYDEVKDVMEKKLGSMSTQLTLDLGKSLQKMVADEVEKQFSGLTSAYEKKIKDLHDAYSVSIQQLKSLFDSAAGVNRKVEKDIVYDQQSGRPVKMIEKTVLSTDTEK